MQTGTYTFVVTVNSPTQVPVLDYIGDQVAVIGQPFTLNLNASETDQDHLDLRGERTSSRRGSDAGNFLRIGDAQLDADRGRYRSHQVTFTVTDTGDGTVTQPSSVSTTIRIVVRASDTAPVFPAASTMPRLPKDKCSACP